MPEVKDGNNAVGSQAEDSGDAGRGGARTPGAGGASGQRPASADIAACSDDSAGPAEQSGDVDRTRVRIAWRIGSGNGHGQWFEKTYAFLPFMVKALNDMHGHGTHWIEQESGPRGAIRQERRVDEQ